MTIVIPPGTWFQEERAMILPSTSTTLSLSDIRNAKLRHGMNSCSLVKCCHLIKISNLSFWNQIDDGRITTTQNLPSQLGNRDDDFFMKLAFNQAVDAFNLEEVPVVQLLCLKVRLSVRHIMRLTAPRTQLPMLKSSPLHCGKPHWRLAA